VLAIVFPPLFIVPFIVAMAQFPNLPDWAVWLGIILFMGISIAGVLYLVRQLSIKVIYTIDGNQHHIKVVQPSVLSPSSFSFETQHIRNFATDTTDNGTYVSMHITTYPGRFNIDANSKSEEDINAFYELVGVIEQLVQESNTIGEATITSKTMYETWWAKLLVVVSVLVLLVVVVLAFVFPEKDLPWYKVSMLVAFLIPWAIKVYSHNRKKG
jgi:hypothetical protein